MAAGINYEIRVSTSFSEEGDVILWKRNPQTKTMKREIIREMTKEEIKRTYKILKDFGKRIYFRKSVLERAGLI